MVNNADFIKRLEKVMKYYSLSASAFAEKIGVQRSSISHILSGRNKPSLEFTMKILTSFPEVDLYWLLNGKGNFPKEEEKKQSIDSTPNFTNQISTKTQNPTPTNSEIERIVIFYKDGSFKNFEN
jgi:transcriptional regulator with XRE-family HTH domain